MHVAINVTTKGGFLKAHGVFEEYTLDDLEQERSDLSGLGL